MSADTVTRHIAAWIAPPAVDGLNTVYPYAKVVTSTADALGTSGAGSGALVWIWAYDQFDTQLAMPVGQQRAVTHRVRLQCLFRSVKTDAQQGQADFAAFKENLLTRLRSSPTLGTASQSDPIFSAGMGELTGPPTHWQDLRFQSDLPITAKNTSGLYIWAQLDMTCNEVIQFTPTEA